MHKLLLQRTYSQGSHSTDLVDIEYYGNEHTWIITNGDRRAQWSCALSAGRDYGRLLSWCIRNVLAGSFISPPPLTIAGVGFEFIVWGLETHFGSAPYLQKTFKEAIIPYRENGRKECVLLFRSAILFKKYFKFLINLSFQGDQICLLLFLGFRMLGHLQPLTS